MKIKHTVYNKESKLSRLDKISARRLALNVRKFMEGYVQVTGGSDGILLKTLEFLEDIKNRGGLYEYSFGYNVKYDYDGNQLENKLTIYLQRAKNAEFFEIKFMWKRAEPLEPEFAKILDEDLFDLL